MVPKYRRKVLIAPYDTRMREIIAEVADKAELIAHAIEVMPDHVHLFVEADPTLAVAEIVNRFKGRSSRLMRQKLPALRLRLRTPWSRSYYAGSVDHVSAKVVKAHIAAQKGS
ncbi:IS200/IS605 family transposase [Methylobacterium sp. 092160098-2]|uniref:IS200/IS605 family transposase n=1 Tax=Methylobacterium sp. 092160098-2 TaxID=3025129 RepID=UPI0031580344